MEYHPGALDIGSPSTDHSIWGRGTAGPRCIPRESAHGESHAETLARCEYGDACRRPRESPPGSETTAACLQEQHTCLALSANVLRRRLHGSGRAMTMAVLGGWGGTSGAKMGSRAGSRSWPDAAVVAVTMREVDRVMRIGKQLHARSLRAAPAGLIVGDSCPA